MPQAPAPPSRKPPERPAPRGRRRPRFGREAGLVWRLGWGRLRRRLGPVAVGLAAVAGLIVLDTGLDDWAERVLRVERHSTAYDVSKALSAVADLELAVPLSLALWLAGAAAGRARLRRLAWACLFATLVAGLAASTLKATTGRPRPSAGLPDGFHGPTLESGLHGYPSGHASTTFATMGVLLPVAPAVGVPAVLYAGAVGWSRVSRDRHHLTDVLAGALLGLVCGLSFAGAVPRARWRLRRRRRRTRG